MSSERRIIYPPIWMIVGVIAIFSLNEFYPGPRYTGEASQLVGGAILVLGCYLLISANGLFTRAGTDIKPFGDVTSLVTDGVFKRTRNPMYLGMLLVLLGCAVTVGAVTALVVPPVFLAIIQYRYILPEEALLRRTFPEEYPEYCERVRRWF